MKNVLILLFTLITMTGSFGQADSTYLMRIDSTTYAEVTNTFDELGRPKLTTYNYIDSSRISDRLFRQTVNLDNRLLKHQDDAQKLNAELNTLSKLYKDHTGKSYANSINNVNKAIFTGEWVLLVGDSTYQVTSNVDNSAIVNTQNSAQKSRIKFVSNSFIEISTIEGEEPFFVDVAYLRYKEHPKKGVSFVGRTANNTKITLRR